VENPEDGMIVTQKSKKQWSANSLGVDYIMYHVDDTPRTTEGRILLLMLTYGRKIYGLRCIQLFIMELRKLLNVLNYECKPV
jgi:hypothetical protein